MGGCWVRLVTSLPSLFILPIRLLEGRRELVLYSLLWLQRSSNPLEIGVETVGVIQDERIPAGSVSIGHSMGCRMDMTTNIYTPVLVTTSNPPTFRHPFWCPN